MPTRAKNICNQPGCSMLCDGRYCEKHTRDNVTRVDRQSFDKLRAGDPHRKLRGTSQWRRTRVFILARDPICRDCRREPSTDVDHIIMAVVWCSNPENDYFDVLNLQGLCHQCHSRKTAREARFGNRTQ